jgi:glutamine synthetase
LPCHAFVRARDISESLRGYKFVEFILAPPLCSSSPKSRAGRGTDPRDCAPGEAYVEYRAPSASANTYLVLAGLAAAGADGVKRELVLPPARDDEAAPLPTSLEEALSALRADEVLVDALGKDFVEWYDLVKRAELADVAAKTARFAATGRAARLLSRLFALLRPAPSKSLRCDRSAGYKQTSVQRVDRSA